jgi:hypothetical protein
MQNGHEGATHMNVHGNFNPLKTGNDGFERFALEECIRRQRAAHDEITENR